jgi:hypothetical protein
VDQKVGSKLHDTTGKWGLFFKTDKQKNKKLKTKHLAS